jgi:beta-glucosidase
VRKVVAELGNYVDFWITINEPLIFASRSYFFGEWPPQERSLSKFYLVVHSLIKAHKRAYKVIHGINKGAKVSLAKQNIYFDAFGNKLINKIGVLLAGFIWNKYFLLRVKKELDFIGLNHYFHNRVRIGLTPPLTWTHHNEDKVVSDMGWEIFPESIYHALKDLAKFKKPIYITENGLADAKDKQRKEFIRDYLCQTRRAMEEGADVRGYLHWSFIDNLEWSMGFGPRFGLVAVDYKTLKRKPRPSAFYYAKICKENGLICG